MTLPLLLAVLAAGPALANQDPAVGQWLTEDGMAHVAVAPCAGDPARICGAVTWLKDPVHHPARDIHNPDRALRARPLIGVLVIRDMTNQGPGRWAGGKVYDPETGRSGDGQLKAVTRNRLIVSGCVLMICDRETWTRVEGD